AVVDDDYLDLCALVIERAHALQTVRQRLAAAVRWDDNRITRRAHRPAPYAAGDAICCRHQAMVRSRPPSRSHRGCHSSSADSLEMSATTSGVSVAACG